jgi:NAD(P)-dependent dehydrogenase (short-subunit alcohol dehydrogenase family)
MSAAGGGSIINISSVAGLFANMHGAGAYSTSKGAVRLLTKAAARDYSAYKHPGKFGSSRNYPHAANHASSFEPRLSAESARANADRSARRSLRNRASSSLPSVR